MVCIVHGVEIFTHYILIRMVTTGLQTLHPMSVDVAFVLAVSRPTPGCAAFVLAVSRPAPGCAVVCLHPMSVDLASAVAL